MKLSKKKYCCVNGSQHPDNQAHFSSCQQSGLQHADNQGKYKGFVNKVCLKNPLKGGYVKNRQKPTLFYGNGCISIYLKYKKVSVAAKKCRLAIET